jgi:hypothetical protein
MTHLENRRPDWNRSKIMGLRPRTKAAKKRRMRIKEERRLRKKLSRVMPMLSRPKKRTD